LIEIGSSSSSSVRGAAAGSPSARSCSYGSLGVAVSSMRTTSMPAGAPSHQRRELCVHQHRPRLRVIENRADLRRAQPRVDRDEHAAGGRHPEVRLEQRRRVRRQHRDAIAAPDAARPQRRGEPVDPRIELLVRAPQFAVNDRDAGGMQRRAALEEREGIKLGAARDADPRPRIARGALRVQLLDGLRPGNRAVHSCCPPEVERGRGEPTAGARSRRVPRSRAGNNPAKSAVARNVLLADWHVLSGEQPFEVAPRRTTCITTVSAAPAAFWPPDGRMELRRRGSSHKHCAMTRAPKEK
jgi:hypothetical protein